MVFDPHRRYGSSIDWNRMAERSSFRAKSPYFSDKISDNIADASSFIQAIAFNNEEYHTAEFFYDAISSLTPEILKEKLQTTSAQGLPELREEVAALIRAYGIESTADNIIIFANASEALNCASTVLMPANTVIFNQEQDGSDTFTQFSQTNLRRCKISADDDGILPDEFKRLLDKNAHMNRILVIDPVNHVPTGTTMPRQRMEEISAICRNEHVPVIETDILRDFALNNPPPTLKSLNPSSVIHIGSPSIASEVGLSFGWAVVPDSLIYKFTIAKYFTYGGNRSWEIFAWLMLKDNRYAKYLEFARKVCAARNNTVNAALSEYMRPYAEWNGNSAVFKTLKLRKGVSVCKTVLNKYEGLSYTKVYNAPEDRIFMSLIRDSSKDLVKMIEDLSSGCYFKQNSI